MTDKTLAGLKVTIPDGTPEFQIGMINTVVEMFKAAGKLTGEDVTESIKPLLERISYLNSLKGEK